MNYKTLLADSGSSASEAMQAYRRFSTSDVCAALGLGGTFDAEEREDIQQGMERWQIVDPLPVEAAVLDTIESGHGFRFPTALRDFYLDNGSFHVADGGGLLLFPPKNTRYFLDEFRNRGYADMFSHHSKLLSDEDLETLRRDFFFFGQSFRDDDGNNSLMLYFHKHEGWFGELLLLDDNHPYMEKTGFPGFFERSGPSYTLDQLMTLQVNRLVVKALDSLEFQGREEWLDEDGMRLLRESELDQPYL